MVVLRLKSLPLAFLVGFPIFLTQSFLSASSPTPGSPLTEDEYRVFFASWSPEWKMRVVCQIRRNKGCQDPRIVQLDQYENHGQIPEGPICADLPQTPSFETFCLFAQFRCSNQNLYSKRILCPKLSVVGESGVPTEKAHSFHLSEAGKQRPQTGLLKEAAPSQENSKLLVKASSPPPDIDVRANIDALLKYAFAVSGQEPVLKSHLSTPPGNWQTLQAPTLQEQPDDSKAWLISAPTKTSISSNFRKIETTEGQTGPSFQQNIPSLVGVEFLREKPSKAENTQAPIDRKTHPNVQEAILETKSKGSLLDLDKNEALVILCYAVLHSSCISSSISKAWKQMEATTFGYGDLVCDNLGRRHADLCSECAFCSLKREQCQGVSDLNRIPCDGGTFTTYINPEILAQHQATGTTVVPQEQFKRMAHGGSQLQYWCGRLATHGCDDSRVALWLQTEYSKFHRGDFPDKICDSTRTVHPNYCAFKSHECLQYSQSGKKVWRQVCQRNVEYRVLSKEEGEKEVQLWSQRYLNFAER